ncbi:DNA polymerase IV, partial [Candidatus Saccharibacteria bacterium]|nr:DNA polymerase IV [Candidatus Saccharibacteria bacterium]
MMDLRINDAAPLVMHIDLNSCYAIIEQQANRLLRHKPVGVAAYDSPGGFIIASSYEARRLGIKLMRIRDARQISKDIVVLTPDPEKYFDAHRRFRKVLERYTDAVTPKSIDEFVLDFTGSLALQRGQSLQEIGYRIKQDIRQELGEYVTVNIGIAPNRFLAKVAAGLDKPDGLDTISGSDILNIYGQLDLVDLPGINTRYKTRLNLADIYTPLDFLEAPMLKLKKQVFKSIVGYYWYLRLRGYEVDAVKFGTRSFGNDYAVGEKTSDPEKVARLIMKLCEKTGRRLRKHDYQAQ